MASSLILWRYLFNGHLIRQTFPSTLFKMATFFLMSVPFLTPLYFSLQHLLPPDIYVFVHQFIFFSPSIGKMTSCEAGTQFTVVQVPEIVPGILQVFNKYVDEQVNKMVNEFNQKFLVWIICSNFVMKDLKNCLQISCAHKIPTLFFLLYSRGGRKRIILCIILEFTLKKFLLRSKYLFSFTHHLLVQPKFTNHLQCASGLCILCQGYRN